MASEMPPRGGGIQRLFRRAMLRRKRETALCHFPTLQCRIRGCIQEQTAPPGNRLLIRWIEEQGNPESAWENGPNSMPDTALHPLRRVIDKLWAPVPVETRSRDRASTGASQVYRDRYHHGSAPLQCRDRLLSGRKSLRQHWRPLRRVSP